MICCAEPLVPPPIASIWVVTLWRASYAGAIRVHSFGHGFLDVCCPLCARHGACCRIDLRYFLGIILYLADTSWYFIIRLTAVHGCCLFIIRLTTSMLFYFIIRLMMVDAVYFIIRLTTSMLFYFIIRLTIVNAVYFIIRLTTSMLFYFIIRLTMVNAPVAVHRGRFAASLLRIYCYCYFLPVCELHALLSCMCVYTPLMLAIISDSTCLASPPYCYLVLNCACFYFCIPISIFATICLYFCPCLTFEFHSCPV